MHSPIPCHIPSFVNVPVPEVSHLRFDSSSFAVSNLAFVNVPEPVPAKISNPNRSYANFSNVSLFFAGTGTGTFTNLTTKHKRQIQTMRP